MAKKTETKAATSTPVTPLNATPSLTAHLGSLLGQPVAVMAARYQYRGRLSMVNDKYIVLANAFAVEVSGPSSAERAQTEDPINGSITIMVDAIEIVYQPRWCHRDDDAAE